MRSLASSPPKEKGACHSAPVQSSKSNQRIRRIFWIVNLLEKLLAALYWPLSQSRSRLQDQVANIEDQDQ